MVHSQNPEGPFMPPDPCRHVFLFADCTQLLMHIPAKREVKLLAKVPSTWVWVKIKPPGNGPQILVIVSGYQGRPLGKLFEKFVAAGVHSLRLTAGRSQKASVNGTKSSKGVLGASMLVWGRKGRIIRTRELVVQQ